MWAKRVPQLTQMPVNPRGFYKPSVLDSANACRACCVDRAEVKVCAGKPDGMESTQPVVSVIFSVKGGFDERHGRLVFAQPGPGDTQIRQELWLGEVGRPGRVSVAVGRLRQEAFGLGEGRVAPATVAHRGECERRTHSKQRCDTRCGNRASDILSDQGQVDSF